MQTDTQRAYELIKEKIITTRMRPGSVIQEAALMEELGLGRTPVREALKRLETEKLVTVSPRRGMFVADVTISDLTNIQELRVVLDNLCVHLAVERMTPAELAEMKKLVEQLAATSKADISALMAIDRRIHKLLAQSTHNLYLEAELELFYNLSMRIWYLYVNQLDAQDLALDVFSDIVLAIEAKDAGRAEKAMAHHIRNFGEAIRQRL